MKSTKRMLLGIAIILLGITFVNLSFYISAAIGLIGLITVIIGYNTDDFYHSNK